VRLVLVAEEAAGVQALRGLLALAEPPDVVAVLTTPPEVARRRAVVHEAARSLGIETRPSELVRDAGLGDRLRRERVDVLLNVHSLHVAHRDVVAAPAVGSFNLHPGPLPEYAGLNVPSWAIYHGEHCHAVTVHWMDGGIDTGAVAYTARLEVAADETGLSLSAKCVRAGVPLLLRLVADAAAGRVPQLDQDLTRRRYFGAGPPDAGLVDWTRSAAEIARFVRAADYRPFRSPWGRVRAELEGRTVEIERAVPTGRPATAPPGTVCDVTDEGVLVATVDEVLRVVSR
jgi:UDP-4-amino-4-deoxy-L-arabinose formyltransferase/UDP-glucuronic acid dehydrogenase (UDP-4-keto-hexauronic acid decarboxylating)